MNAEIPDKVIAYNIYTNGVKLGVTGKVDTPEFKMKTSTMSGAGVGGEIEVRLSASGRRRSMRFRLRCLERIWQNCCSRAWTCSLSIVVRRSAH